MVTAPTGDASRKAPATLCDVVAGFDGRGRRPAIVDFTSGRELTIDFVDLAARIEATAHALRAQGIRRQSAVALWAPNSVDWVVAYFGIVRAGALVVPIDQQTTAGAAAAVLEHSSPAMLLTTAAHCAELGDAGRGHATYVIDGDSGNPQSWLRWREGGPGELPAPRREDLAALLYTSGTTGTPKAVPLTHGNLAANAAALCEANLIGPRDRVLVPLPLHHTYPCTVGVITVLAKGAAVVFPSGISGPEITTCAREAAVTVLLAVPRLCEALWESVRATVERRGERTARTFHRLLRLSMRVRRLTGLHAGKWLFRPVHERLGAGLDLIGCGGAKLDPELAWRLEGLGWTVLTGYGLTETSPVLTFNDRSHTRLGTEGRPLHGVELEIRREPSQEQGEIVARGPSVFSGYRGNEEATAAAFTADGWFRTGDLGWLDREGYLHVVGRSKELIVLADGKKVFPDELEKIYGALDFLREIAILEHGGKLAALIVPDEEAIRARGTLREAVLVREELEEIAARLPPYQRLSAYRVTHAALPRTQLGKLRRHLLPELYRQADPVAAKRPAAAEPSRADAELLVRPRAGAALEWLKARYPDRDVNLDTSPQLELEIDSLEWVAITTDLEQRFHVTLTGDAVSRILTVRDLLREIDSAAPARATAATPEASALPLPGTAMRAVGAAMFATLRPVVRTAFRVRVSGIENLAADMPLVITPNHTSYLDPVVLSASLPWSRLRRTFWAGWVGVMYTGPLTRFVSRAAQVLPVDPDRDLAAALRTARDLLRQGYSIVWFPEGRRSPTGELGPFFGGVGRLVLETGALVVPTAIRGTFEAWPKQRRLPRIRPVSVTFGEPLRLRESNAEGRAATRISATVENAVRALLATRETDAAGPHDRI
jgi:long-chain acyl-CoA synthetase